MEETRSLIERVLFFFYEGYQPTPQRIDELGGGWPLKSRWQLVFGAP